MPIVSDNPTLPGEQSVIHGRPDFSDHQFGMTLAKKHAPYVFGIRSGSCLVHKVLRVELHWYTVGRSGQTLIKLARPEMVAVTHCQYYFRLDPRVARTCRVPNHDALLCGRCLGEVAPFGKRGLATKAGITRTFAHVKLGCVVNGY